MMENTEVSKLVQVDLDDSDSDDTVDETWIDDDGDATTCLFCDNISSSVESAIDHLKNTHDLSLTMLKSRFQMDQYSFLKLINCIRLEKVPLSKLIEAEKVFWSDEKYLKPLRYEPWLSYDYEDMPGEAEVLKTCQEKQKTAADDTKLLLQSLQHKVESQERLLEQAVEHIHKMRTCFLRLVEKGSSEETVPLNCVSAASPGADESYFSSYSHFGIHHEMLSDVVRTTSYRDALLNNKEFVLGKDVLDVGCGTAVLSIFASQAGANTVVGIDNSDIIYNAMDIVKNNNIENVSLVKGRLEETALPQEKFDIIISEWMGYFLLFEGMLDSVIYARDNHLKEGGTLLPNRCTLKLLGYGNEELFESHIGFWDDVYGLDMSVMRREVLREPLIDVVDVKHILTEPTTIADLNLLKTDLNYSNFSYNFRLTCLKAGKLSSFVGYFDTYFDLPNSVVFSTGPGDQPTHWKQVVFFMDQSISVKGGDIVSGKLTCRRSRCSARSLDVTIEIINRKYNYCLD